MAKAKRWCVDERDLVDVKPQTALKLITRCFVEAQQETLAKASRDMGVADREGAVIRTVETTVRMAFDETGGDYERPTPESLQQVVGVLARKAVSLGTPEEVIEHHKGEIGRIFAALGS